MAWRTTSVPAATSRHWHRFFVDVIALALAFAYWQMAKTTLARGRDRDPNTEWALR
ncbi:hypothetical protein [Dyella lutea]|uniref:Uncharacterized protein n=1 Tax=Dyella lutea TaxID=2950441 RepID=A0ABT1FCT8_9GAMM|nr:hypothetical protein [Dyella lutea]MCP1375175.1 hypothetical protein [Dyella lutea]